MKIYLSYLLTFLISIALLQPFHTRELYSFESETSAGVAGLLFFRDQLVDTISMDRLQTDANSAVYIEFVRYTHDPPYDWDAVYGTEGNYRVFHNGRTIPGSRFPNINEFSSPRLYKDRLIYWGFVDGKVFGFRADLNSLAKDSILIFEKTIGTDFRYAYDFPIPKDSLYLFRTLAGTRDSVLVDFEEDVVTKLH